MQFSFLALRFISSCLWLLFLTLLTRAPILDERNQKEEIRTAKVAQLASSRVARMAARVDETGREKKAPPPEFSERKRAGKRKARESYVRRCGLVVSPRRRRLGCLGYTRQESIMFMETGAGKEKRLQRRESFARLPKCAFFVFPPAPVFSDGSDEATSHFFPFLFYFFSLLWSGYRFFLSLHLPLSSMKPHCRF